MTEQLRAIGLRKTFTLHNQGGLELPVLDGVDLAVAAGECVVLNGPSGVGKSTMLRALYGNYLVQGGHILVRHQDEVVDMANAPPRLVLDVRRRTIGFVSQFLRVIPRVSTLDLVTEPLRRLMLHPDRTTALLCGPEPMLRFGAEALIAKGLAARDIRVSLERNMECGIALCGHCQLGPLLICRDGPVVGYDVAGPLLRAKEL